MDIELLQPNVLNDYLRRFYAQIKSKEGLSYSAQSLIGLRAGIHRYLSSAPYCVSFNIISDSMFKTANDVIKDKIVIMKQEGKEQPRSSLTLDDIKLLYSSYTLSCDNPTSLLYKVYFDISLHFGCRGREGYRDLKKYHFIFVKDGRNIEYGTLNQNPDEKIKKRQKEHDQRIYGTGDSNCPLYSLKLYLGKLNPGCDVFFQRPKVENYIDEKVWYCNSPLGKNTIGKLMNVISEKARLSRIYTNNCIRATKITTLRDAGILPFQLL